MRINNNIMAMNTHRQYTINTNSVSKSMEKLSSGYRVNRAGDDAAGLAISEKMRAQIRGLQMASKNSSDAISLVQTAEGALQESHNILQRMRELAVQSSSDTNETSIDRAALNAEFKQLIAELDDTADKAKFNDMGVIDGTFGASVSKLNLDTDFQAVHIVMASEKLNSGAHTITFDGTDTFTLKETAAGGNEFTVKLSESELREAFKKGAHTVQFEDGSTFSYTLGEDVKHATNVPGEFQTMLGSVALTITKANPLTIQSGANQGDELKISIDRMDSEILGLKNSGAANYNSNISTREDASKAITATNLALNLVSSQRSKMGALQNRLTHKISNLDTSAENLSAAESRIRDLDMAWEMTNFTRNNILTQASTAMLAQANVAPQGVLSLLG